MTWFPTYNRLFQNLSDSKAIKGSLLQTAALTWEVEMLWETAAMLGSGGEFDSDWLFTMESYGAKNWLVSLANTLQQNVSYKTTKFKLGVENTREKEIYWIL